VKDRATQLLEEDKPEDLKPIDSNLDFEDPIYDW
jgi:hypothetical protein